MIRRVQFCKEIPSTNRSGNNGKSEYSIGMISSKKRLVPLEEHLTTLNLLLIYSLQRKSFCSVLLAASVTRY